MCFFCIQEKNKGYPKVSFIFGAEGGTAPLAARPAGQLSIVHFADGKQIIQAKKAKRSLPFAAPTLKSHLIYEKKKNKGYPKVSFIFGAEGGT